MNILIAGFPYIRSTYRDTFKHYPEGDGLSFLLPKRWPIKKGAVVFDAPHEPTVISTDAFFYHSHYPIVGGLLKGWMPAFPLELYRLRKEKKVDLVYSCSEPILLTTVYQALWAKLLGCRHVFFSWENIAYEDKFSGFNLFVKRCILKLNIFLSDGIICGNGRSKEIFQQYTKKPVEVIPMSGTDSDFFEIAAGGYEFRGHSLHGRTVFTFAGAIGYRKGISYLLEAFSDVRKEISDAVLVIAGSGEYENELQKLVEAGNFSDSIVLIPWLDRNQLRALLSISDVFLYPSISHQGWEEQFGYSMAEASLMEIPVIATETGSIAEVVIHEKTGILVKPNSAGELADAMIRLGTDKTLRKQFGQAGRRHITEHFSHVVIAKKFHDFFHRIIQS